MLHPPIHIARLQYLASGLALVLVVTALHPASAQPTIQQCANGATRTPTKEIVIPGKHGSFDVDVHRDVLATVEMPDEISGVTFPRHVAERFWFEVAEDRSAIEFKPINFPVGHVTTLNLKSDKADMAVTARIRVVSKATQIDHSLYRVRKKSMAQTCLDMIASQIDQEVEKVEQRYQHELTKLQEEREQERAAYEREKREQAATVRRETRTTLARHLLDHALRDERSIPVEVVRGLSNPRAQVSILEPVWHGDEILIPFELKSQTGDTLDFTGVKATDEQENELPSEVLVLEGMEKPTLPVAVPPDHPIRGVIGISATTRSAVTPLRLTFTTADAMPIVVLARRWYPVDEERILKEQRMRQTSVSVGPTGGAIWFGDGVTPNSSGPTGVAGLVIRIQKGYYWGGALEATITGARTGQASFADVDWNGSSGNVMRQATLGRALGTFAMRFGYDNMFTGRVGLGFQAASNQARFIPEGDTETRGPADGLALDGLWIIGAGFDKYLTKNWALGLEASFIAVAARLGEDGIRGSFEAGLQLRYGWGR